jgi:uncharacterized protein
MSDVLLIPVLVWVSTQLIKAIRQAREHRAMHWQYILQSGGMPSAHTSTVSSLALMVGLKEGFDSSLFAVTAVFSGIVLYDAFGVRRSSGEQAKMINRLLSKLFPKREPELKDLRVVLGHNPVEVVGGILYGLVLTYVLQFYL